jgi:hypothetical protein
LTSFRSLTPLATSWDPNDRTTGGIEQTTSLTLSITSFYCISRILTMKLPSVLLLLPTLLLPLRAFQPTVGTPIRTQAAKLVSMNFFPDNFARAEYCATHSGACSLEELEVLADGRLRRYVALSQTSCSLYRYVPHC